MNWKILSAYVIGSAVLVLILTRGGNESEIAGRAKTVPESSRSETAPTFLNADMTYDSAFGTGAPALENNGSQTASLRDWDAIRPVVSRSNETRLAPATPSAYFSVFLAEGSLGDDNSSVAGVFSTPNLDATHRPPEESPLLQDAAAMTAAPKTPVNKLVLRYPR